MVFWVLIFLYKFCAQIIRLCYYFYIIIWFSIYTNLHSVYSVFRIYFSISCYQCNPCIGHSRVFRLFLTAVYTLKPKKNQKTNKLETNLLFLRHYNIGRTCYIITILPPPEKKTSLPTRCSENHNNNCAENRKFRGLKFDTLYWRHLAA